MADEMTRQEFAEYMEAFEQRLNLRFGRSDRRLDGIDGRLDGIDGRLDGIDGRLDGIDGRLDQHDRRFDALDTQMMAHGSRFDRLETGLSELKQSMTIQFEETRREFKLSLEAVRMVEERTGRGFAQMGREHAEHKSLIEAVIRDVGGRTTQLEARDKQRRAPLTRQTRKPTR